VRRASDHRIHWLRLTTEQVVECKGWTTHKTSKFTGDRRIANKYSTVVRDTRGKASKLEQDYRHQLVGMCGELAFSLFQFGSPEPWRAARQATLHRSPYAGDDASDVYGYRIDVKSQEIRDGKVPLTRRSLLVRPGERHRGAIYVGTFMYFTDGKVWKPEWRWTCHVALCGWAWEHQLPGGTEDYGALAGTHALRYERTQSLPIDEASLEQVRVHTT